MHDPRLVHYWREIVVILAVKVAALYAIHETWFDQPISRAERIEHLDAQVYGSVHRAAESPESGGR